MDMDNICRYMGYAATIYGASYIFKLALRESWTFFNGFHAYFLAPRGILNINIKTFGSWAVVTGASDGIGRGYALELAKQGLNVVLISRTEHKLNLVADEIRSQYCREVLVIVADFTDGHVVFPAIAAKLKDIDIGILVNNVGLSYIHPEYFLEVTAQRHRQIVEINCQTMVQMIHTILPKMLQKKKGIVVNISSISEVNPTGLLATYSASKIFIRYITDALRLEYSSQGIIFQSVASGMVTTAMSNARKVTFFTPDPIRYSQSAVATIGIQNSTNGYWPHGIQQYLCQFFTKGQLMYGSYQYMKKSRKILLKRKAEGTLVSQLRLNNELI